MLRRAGRRTGHRPRSDRRQAHPAGAVGRVGHRGARGRGARLGGEHHLAVADRGQHVDRCVLAAADRSHASSGRADKPMDGSGSRTGRFPMSRTSTRSARSLVSPTGGRSNRSGINSSGGRPRWVYQAAIAGIAAASAEISSGTAELASKPAPRPARSSQPSSQVWSTPGQAGGGSVFERPDLRGAHRRVGENPQRDGIGGRELDQRTRLRPHPHHRIDRQQVPYRIGQWRYRTRGPPVANGHPRAEVRPQTIKRPSVTERVGSFTRRPRQSGNAPAV